MSYTAGIPENPVQHEPPPPPPAAPAQGSHADLDRAVSLLIPLKVDGLAVASGYLALLSPLALVAASSAPVGARLAFLFPAMFAILLGVLAVRRIRRTPGARGIFRAWFGIVLPSLFLALVTAIVVASAS